MTSNEQTFRIGLGGQKETFNRARVRNLWYKLAGSYSSLVLKTTGLDKKIELPSNSKYFLYLPLSTFTGTVSTYSNPFNDWDYKSMCGFEVNELNLSIIIDGSYQGVSALNPVVVEFEFESC